MATSVVLPQEFVLASQTEVLRLLGLFENYALDEEGTWLQIGGAFSLKPATLGWQ